MNIFRKITSFISSLFTKGGNYKKIVSSGRIQRTRNGRRKLDEADIEKLKAFRAEKYKCVEERDGVREFTIDGVTVKARDLENARRKVKNLLNHKKL